VADQLLHEEKDLRVLGHRRKLDGLAARGAEVVTGDAFSPDDLGALLDGAEAALVLLPEDLTDRDFVANRSRMATAIADAVARSGVGRVVLLSTVGAGLADWPTRSGPRPGSVSSSSGCPGWTRSSSCCGPGSTWRTCWPRCH
jgi:uncharacterized protein YbjT (DUF2867 family)